MANLKTGDRVRHIGRNETGTVTIMPNGDTQVLFDKPAPSGRPSIGLFDERWFSTHPNWLQAMPAPTALPSRHYKSDFKPG